MNKGWKEEYKALPKAGSHRLIDFDEALVVTDRPPAFPPQFLSVSGRKPYANMWVVLAPLVCVGRPEYRGIEVVGHLPLGIGLPIEEAQKAQYNATISLYSGLTGTKGIELMGATRSERIEVQHDKPVGECSEWEAWHDHMPGGPATLRVTGVCRFPDESYQAKLRRREPQGINPKDLLLELIVTEEPGWEEKETTLEVRYEEQTDFEYDTVTVLPDVVTVPVKEVH